MWALHAIVCPCKRKTDGDLKDRKREGNVIREADIGVMRAQAGGCLQLPEAGKSVCVCMYLGILKRLMKVLVVITSKC